MPESTPKARIECTNPILNVKDMFASLSHYTKVLGFKKAEWVHDGSTFALVERDGCGIYLSQGSQGEPGTWVWIGVEDIDAIHEELQSSGAKIIREPTNYSWACEIRVEDPDCHVLRFGGPPKQDQPFVDKA